MKRIITVICLFLSAAVLTTTHLFPQAYEGTSCSKYTNEVLAGQLKNGIVPELIDNSMNYISTDEQWATSSLKPDVKKPVRNADEEDFDYSERVDRWTCMYSPFSAHDADTKTAWVEGAGDDGIGEILLVRLNIDAPAEIWAGIGASPALFKANNRPKKIRVYVLAGKAEDAAPGAQYSMMKYSGIRVQGKHEIELRDINGYQDFRLPGHAGLKEGEAGFIAIEILSVYRGTKFRDTGITEVRNR